MFKGVKSKIAAGVIVAGLVAGAGTVFAGVDAGAQFKNWYGAVFTNVSTQIKADADANTTSKLNDYKNKDLPALTKKSTDAVVQTYTTSTNAAKSAISKQSSDYKNAVNLAAIQVGFSIPNDFVKLLAEVKSNVDSATSQVKSSSQDGLKTAIDGQGQTSKDKLAQDIAGYTKTYGDDLSNSIDQAKDGITKAVNGAADLSNKAANAYIDAKVSDLKGDLQKYADSQVSTNQQAIQKAGQDGQAAALKSLDDIVTNSLK